MSRALTLDGVQRDGWDDYQALVALGTLPVARCQHAHRTYDAAFRCAAKIARLIKRRELTVDPSQPFVRRWSRDRFTIAIAAANTPPKPNAYGPDLVARATDR